MDGLPNTEQNMFRGEAEFECIISITGYLHGRAELSQHLLDLVHIHKIQSVGILDIRVIGIQFKSFQ